MCIRDSHILNAQRVAAHGFDLPAERNEHLQIVDRTQRIADTTLCMAACLETFVHSGLDVAQIVQPVSYTHLDVYKRQDKYSKRDYICMP